MSADVNMGDHRPHTNGINGSHTNGDVDMQQDEEDAKIENAGSPYSSSRERADEDDGAPPAKRARILSDVDKGSLTHVSTFFSRAPSRAC